MPSPAGKKRRRSSAIASEKIAYYKAPGWIHFVPDIPTTGTQKIQKHTIYPKGT